MKLSRWLFYGLILLLPTQLGKHFWPDWSLIQGLRVDYLSPTIYLTDILVLGILGFWGREFLTKVKSQKLKILFIILTIGFLILNSYFAQNQPAAFYKLAKLAEFILLGIYVAQNRDVLRLTGYMLALAVVYSSLLAIFQFLNQGSLARIFWFLGERTFSSGTPGIAQTVWNGRLILRPYATFSHPNVLAGFLVISLLLLMNFQKWGQSIPRVLRVLVFGLGTITLFLTFSRAAWGVWGLLLAIFGIRFFKSFRKKILAVFLFFCFFVFLFLVFPVQSESIALRQDLNLAALKMIQSSPLFGIGLGNFLIRLPEFYQDHGLVRFLQPAHNLYLLIASETGIIGLIGPMGFLILTIRRLLLAANYLLLATLGAILLLGFFDHYFYTLQQGQLLFSLVVGLAWSSVLK